MGCRSYHDGNDVEVFNTQKGAMKALMDFFEGEHNTNKESLCEECCESGCCKNECPCRESAEY